MKHFFREYSGYQEGVSRYQPAPRVNESKLLLNVLTSKAVVPGDAEIERNPRSRSSKLRIAERIGKAGTVSTQVGGIQ